MSCWRFFNLFYVKVQVTYWMDDINGVFLYIYISLRILTNIFI